LIYNQIWLGYNDDHPTYLIKLEKENPPLTNIYEITITMGKKKWSLEGVRYLCNFRPMGGACHPCIIRPPNVSPNMFVYHAPHGASSIVALLKLSFGNGRHTLHPPSSFFLHFFFKLITKIFFGILLCALWCFCKFQRNWKFVIIEFFSTFPLGAIVIKRANSDKGLNHKGLFFNILIFSWKGFFGRIFLQHVFKKYWKVHQLIALFLNKYDFF